MEWGWSGNGCRQGVPIAAGLSAGTDPSALPSSGGALSSPPATIPLQVLNEDGYSSTIKDKILTIDVKPGWRQGTRITFEKEGDQVRGKEAGLDLS